MRCPFCDGAALSAPKVAPRRHVRRAVVLASAASVVVACGGDVATPSDGGSKDATNDAPVAFDAAYGGPPIDAGLDAPIVFYGGPFPDAGKD
jgi:hypothetical protein